MENQKLNLYQKLLEIQKRVVGLGKDGKSYGYQYVTGTKVLEFVKPLMNEYGLLLKQEITSIENTRQDYSAKAGAKSEILTKAMMRFTWVDVDTGEKDVNEFGANGQNDWEKGLGSSLTYAERYFLLKYFHIATDEDDIDNPDRKPAEAAQPQKQQAPKQAPQQQQAEASKQEPQKQEAQPEEPITEPQKLLLLKLINSSVFTQKEKDDTVASIPKLTKVRAIKAIKWAEDTRKERKAPKEPANAS